MNLFDSEATAAFELDTLRGVRIARPHYTLFAAVLPAPDDALRLRTLGNRLRSANRLSGTLLKPDRLHITLHTLGSFEDAVPANVVEAARFAGRRVQHPPVPVSFDHAMTFRANNAFVLRCTDSTQHQLARLRAILAIEFRRVGIRPAPSNTPHMTLLYDGRRITDQSINPICWIAKRLVLVLSHVGAHHHQHVAEYELTV